MKVILITLIVLRKLVSQLDLDEEIQLEQKEKPKAEFIE